MIVIKDLKATVLIATRDSSQAFKMLYAQSEQLLKERDAAEVRAEAYRNGWINRLLKNANDGSIGSFGFSAVEDAEEHVDAEAQRILEAKKEGA